MSTHEIERISTEFHVPVYETGACRVGVVVKFWNFYLKIYDDKNCNYQVQVWLYGKQMPMIVTTVKREHLMTWLRDLICNKLRRKRLVGSMFYTNYSYEACGLNSHASNDVQQ